MTPVNEIRKALITRLKDGIGLSGHEFVPSKIEPPMAAVLVSRIAEGSFGFGSVDFGLDLVVFTSTASDRAGQLKLDEFTSFDADTSVWLAVAALDLTDVQLKIDEYRGLTLEEVAAYPYYGGVFTISGSSW